MTNNVEWDEVHNHRCPWEYPNPSHPSCDAPVRVPVMYGVSGTCIWYCLNHAQREVNGGQAQYVHVEDAFR